MRSVASRVDGARTVTDIIELAEGTRIRIGGANFRVVQVIDNHKPIAVLVARRTERTSRSVRPMQTPDLSSSEPFPHVDRKVQSLLWGQIDDRIERFRASADSDAPWIARPIQEQAIRELEDLANKGGNANDRYLAIVGPQGAGKRTAVETFAERRSRRISSQDDLSIPVVVVRSWESASRLYESCVEGIDVRGADLSKALRRPGLKNAQRRKIAIDAMKAAGVRLVIVETLHHYVDPTSVQVRQRIETLDAFVDELGVAVACTHPRPLRLPGTWSSPWRDARQLVLERCAFGPEFDQILRGFERRLPLREPSGLDEPTMAERLHAFSQGDLGVVWSCLVEWASEALLSGAETIDHALIDSFDRTDWKPTETNRPDDQGNSGGSPDDRSDHTRRR